MASKAAAKPSHEALGKAIRELRKEKHLSQAKLAERSGLHVTYVSGLENGARNPTWTVLSALSAALGVSVLKLAKRAEEI
jgi:transcriptional regulator with XRE-family HTH domain